MPDRHEFYWNFTFIERAVGPITTSYWNFAFSDRVEGLDTTSFTGILRLLAGQKRGRHELYGILRLVIGAEGPGTTSFTRILRLVSGPKPGYREFLLEFTFSGRPKAQSPRVLLDFYV